MSHIELRLKQIYRASRGNGAKEKRPFPVTSHFARGGLLAKRGVAFPSRFPALVKGCVAIGSGLTATRYSGAGGPDARNWRELAEIGARFRSWSSSSVALASFPFHSVSLASAVRRSCSNWFRAAVTLALRATSSSRTDRRSRVWEATFSRSTPIASANSCALASAVAVASFASKTSERKVPIAAI